jgi:hypothetical protein
MQGFMNVKWNLYVTIQRSVSEGFSAVWNRVTNSAFAQRPRTTVGTGSRDLSVEYRLPVSSQSGKQNSEPDHNAVPVLLDVGLERHLIGSATSSLICHVRRELSEE